MAAGKMVFKIENLGCANCASKMENAINKMPEIELAMIDFPNSKLHLNLNPGYKKEGIVSEIDQLIKTFEGDAGIISENTSDKGDISSNENFSEETDTAIKKIDWRKSFPLKLFIRFLTGALIFVSAFLPLWTEFVSASLFVLAWIVLGYDVIIRAFKKLFSRQLFDENFLMSIATIGALIIGEYPEAVAVMLFYQVGEIFQDVAVNHSRSSIKALTELRPDYANRLQQNSQTDYQTVMPQEIEVGDRLLIKPGERVPLDCVIVNGFSDIDMSALTGESIPVSVSPGDEALSGSVNGTGLLVAQVRKNFSESSISRILEMVETAAARKSPAEKYISKFAAWYTPIMIIIATMLAFIPPLILSEPFSDWIYRALILLVISCPCALVLSVPMSYFAGLGASSAKGLLIKGGQYLEKLSQVKQIVFDKTGTLTKGKFVVTNIKSFANEDEESILEIAAKLEKSSNHPIAKSIYEAWLNTNKNINDEIEWQDYRDRPGYGVQAFYQGIEYKLGNDRMITEAGLIVPENIESSAGRQRIWLIIGNTLSGYIELSDQVREGVLEMLLELKNQGIEKTALLSGDKYEAAHLIASSLGIEEVYSDLLPDQKVEKLEDFMQKNNNRKGATVFVGDGINDAPVLARSDLGIAVGSASDAAVESADIVLVGHDLKKINTAINIARKTAKIVRQNVALTLSLKGIILILALFGLGGIWQAVFADVGVTLLAVFNAMRILRD